MAEFSWEQMTWVRSFSGPVSDIDRFRGPDGREVDVPDKGQKMKEAQMEAYQLWIIGAK